jgi:heme-degrading monooxygenase HmoA
MMREHSARGNKERVFSRTWRFLPAPGAEQEFVRVYGPDGEWARLFRQGTGYLGTELRHPDADSAEYVTIDRWESEVAWEAFRRWHAEAYEALDRRCEGLTVQESPVDDGERGG